MQDAATAWLSPADPEPTETTTRCRCARPCRWIRAVGIATAETAGPRDRRASSGTGRSAGLLRGANPQAECRFNVDFRPPREGRRGRLCRRSRSAGVGLPPRGRPSRSAASKCWSSRPRPAGPDRAGRAPRAPPKLEDDLPHRRLRGRRSSSSRSGAVHHAWPAGVQRHLPFGAACFGSTLRRAPARQARGRKSPPTAGGADRGGESRQRAHRAKRPSSSRR